MRTFVHGGNFPRDTARVLTGLQKEREEADYDRKAGLQAEDVEDAMQSAAAFRTAVRGLLQSEG